MIQLFSIKGDVFLISIEMFINVVIYLMRENVKILRRIAKCVMLEFYAVLNALLQPFAFPVAYHNVFALDDCQTSLADFMGNIIIS